MKKRNASDIVEILRAGGEIDDETRNWVLEKLKSPDEDADIYDLMRALALSCPPTLENVGIVEKYLNYETDDWLIKGAIYALCNYWALTGDYLHFLMSLTDIDKWEYFSDASIAAISTLGIYANEKNDIDIRRHLIERYFSNCKDGCEREVYCDCILSALEVSVYGRSLRLLSRSIREKSDDEKVIADVIKLTGYQFN